MKSRLGLFAALLLGLVALAGCATIEAVLGGKATDAPQDVVAAPAAPSFTFYDSFANW